MLTEQLKRQIARVAFTRMEQECDTDFRFMSTFRSDRVNRFLAWMTSLPKAERLEAALSVTCRQLRLRHIEARDTPNFDRWVSRYGAFPLNAGFDHNWHPKRYAKMIVSRVKSELAPLRVQGPQSVELSEDNPLAIPEIRAGLELNTKLADIVLLQFIKDDSSLFDASYMSLLGVGPTAWNIREASDLEEVFTDLPLVIGRVRELFVGE